MARTRPDDQAVLRTALDVVDDQEVDWERAVDAAHDASKEVIRWLSVVANVARRTGDEHAEAAADFWGRFHLGPSIGTGRFARVFTAKDPLTERPVVVKLVEAPPGATKLVTAALEGAMLATGRALAKIRHPNLVRVHGAARRSERIGLWLERVDGETVAELTARAGSIPPAHAATFGANVCHALSTLHEAGIAHGEVHERNVMVRRDGTAVLMDCGPSQDPLTIPLLLEGAVATRVPAEVRASHDVTHATDIFAVGVLLCTMTTGGDGGTSGGGSGALDAIVARACADSPADRFERARELGAALESVAKT